MIAATQEIFLDSNSTTPVDPRVARVVCCAYARFFGNPSSAHRFGWRAKNLLGQARRNVAGFLGAESDEIFFVPSVTIALNVAVQGILEGSTSLCRRLALARTEHPSITALASYVNRKLKVEIVELELNKYGEVIPESAGDVAQRGVDLICVSHGNGETGCLNDIDKIIAETSKRAPLLLDVSQTAAYFDLSSARVADCLILSGHKLYGPRGMAAMYKQRRLDIAPILIGAGQEGGLIPGTEDVPGAIALGVAAQLARREHDRRRLHVNALREKFLGILSSLVPHVEVNGHPTRRLPGHLSLTVPGVPSELLIRRLPHLGFSMASACTGTSESQVLNALGFSRSRIASTFRIGFNAFSSSEEAEKAGVDMGREILNLRRRP